MMHKYVHGYNDRETQRLYEQAAILRDILHRDVTYPAGSRVLEAGCGVGAQTVTLAACSPGADITSVDISEESLANARQHIVEMGLQNVTFRQADIMDLPFADDSFDHIFVCFVLEHLDEPDAALGELKRRLKKGGTITVIEGDHGSCFWHPQTEASLAVWRALITVQEQLGHRPLIGRELYPVLSHAGFHVRDVSPVWVYADSLSPELRDGQVNKIIVPMVETARETALKQGLVEPEQWQRGIAELSVSGAPPDGTFFYTWFKAVAVK